MTDRPRVWTVPVNVSAWAVAAPERIERARTVEWDRDRTVAAMTAAIESFDRGPDMWEPQACAEAIFDALDNPKEDVTDRPHRSHPAYALGGNDPTPTDDPTDPAAGLDPRVEAMAAVISAALSGWHEDVDGGTCPACQDVARDALAAADAVDPLRAAWGQTGTGR